MPARNTTSSRFRRFRFSMSFWMRSTKLYQFSMSLSPVEFSPAGDRPNRMVCGIFVRADSILQVESMTSFPPLN